MAAVKVMMTNGGRCIMSLKWNHVMLTILYMYLWVTRVIEGPQGRGWVDL